MGIPYFEQRFKDYADTFGNFESGSPCKKALWNVVILAESILNADTKELVAFYEKCYEEDVLFLPLWIRLMILKLYILENPHDKEFIRNAISDLMLFHPDAYDAVEQFRLML